MIVIVPSHVILAMVLMRPLVAVPMPCMAMIMAMVMVHMIGTV